MAYPTVLRETAERYVPALMAQRARRYERELRLRNGQTAAANEIVDPVVGAIVLSGPFAGLRYPTDRLSEVDTPLGKLTGAYEVEIYQPFEKAIASGTRTFIDVGCADGYYAAGMAFASPNITTHAFDLAASARNLCLEVAEINAVSQRVRVEKRFSLSSLSRIDPSGALMLCDIEGGEADLFTTDLVARLRLTTTVIEVHEDARPGISDKLRALLSPSHDLETVHQRSQNADESRPPLMHWLIARP
jgi:hypothetical protein